MNGCFSVPGEPWDNLFIPALYFKYCVNWKISQKLLSIHVITVLAAQNTYVWNLAVAPDAPFYCFPLCLETFSASERSQAGCTCSMILNTLLMLEVVSNQKMRYDVRTTNTSTPRRTSQPIFCRNMQLDNHSSMFGQRGKVLPQRCQGRTQRSDANLFVSHFLILLLLDSLEQFQQLLSGARKRNHCSSQGSRDCNDFWPLHMEEKCIGETHFVSQTEAQKSLACIRVGLSLIRAVFLIILSNSEFFSMKSQNPIISIIY